MTTQNSSEAMEVDVGYNTHKAQWYVQFVRNVSGQDTKVPIPMSRTYCDSEDAARQLAIQYSESLGRKDTTELST